MLNNGENGRTFLRRNDWKRQIACGNKAVKSANKSNETSALPLERVLSAFEEAGVKHLILGGQAAIAYGVSQFTQDADLWIEPTVRNVARLRNALKSLRARPRFLPPLELRHLKRGHGIHFVLPYGNGSFYLDLLGKPPRVGSFADAWRDATVVNWRGLGIRILDVRRLVDTKKTNRDQDYIVIQRLSELVYHQVRRDPKQQSAAQVWLLNELRTPRLLKTVALRWPGAKTALRKTTRHAALLAAANATLAEIQKALDEEKSKYQQANLDYWKTLLRELRQIKREMAFPKSTSKVE
jgi:hypothetical protein